MTLICAESANENDDCKKLSGQFRKCVKPCDQEIPQERIVEQVMDVPVPQATGEIVEAFELIPQERVKQCTGKQTDDQNKQQLQDNQQQLARQAARQEIEKGMKGRRKTRMGEKLSRKGTVRRLRRQSGRHLRKKGRRKERERGM